MNVDSTLSYSNAIGHYNNTNFEKKTFKFEVGVLRATLAQKAKFRGFRLALNTLLGLNGLK
jgi:hypothetical protein